ncbi:MAG: hypothetical protein ABH951_00420 [Patescibacteria group bacterium]
MSSKIKNILIFLGIAVALILVYVLVFKKSPEQPALISTSGSLVTTTNITEIQEKTSTISRDFLAILLSVKNIKIDDSIFSDPAFMSLNDSSIQLISDGNEGRPNPFAPLGTDIFVSSDSLGLTTSTDPITPTIPILPIIPITPTLPIIPTIPTTGTGN